MRIVEPIDILLVAYKRLNFLKETIDKISERTFYPHRVWVISQAANPDEAHYLKHVKKVGKIWEHIFLPDNVGQPAALNEGFKRVQSKVFVTTQDDIIPPDLRPCWLERLVHLINKYEDYGAICMRIQRTARLEIDETKELIDTVKSMPSVFRIQRKDEMPKERPFGRLKHWESQAYAEMMQSMKKKYAMATNLYANHTGYMFDNKGYKEGDADYFTYSKERVKQGEEKPYPEIDPKTNIPVKVKHPYDIREQNDRDQIRIDSGYSNNRSSKNKQVQRDLLKKYCIGKGIDIGCGQKKICEEAIGVDLFQYDTGSVDMVGISSDDLWIFNNNELDYIVSSHCLEHSVDTKKTLKEWDRVLKLGGIIGMIVPDGEKRAKTIIEDGHKVAFTKQTLDCLMKRFLKYKRIELRNMTEIPHGNAQRSILAVYKKI